MSEDAHVCDTKEDWHLTKREYENGATRNTTKYYKTMKQSISQAERSVSRKWEETKKITESLLILSINSSDGLPKSSMIRFSCCMSMYDSAVKEVGVKV